MKKTFNIIGKPVNRKDTVHKVTGTARYTADIHLENTHWGILVRSPHHAARVLNINVSNAIASSGVVAVLTAKDIPGCLCHGAIISDQPVLARDVIRHAGEPVALVIARSREEARTAADSIVVDYELMEPVMLPELALNPDSRLVHESGNLLTHYEIENGDLETGFEQSDVTLEEKFFLPRVSPGYLEPETSLARWNYDGSITVWVSSQQPFLDQEKIADVLGLPLEKIQVISGEVGGAFGGKEDSTITILAALGALAIKGIVRLVNERWESFLAHPKRHPAIIHMKIGAKSDGTLTALDAKVCLDTGAYASLGPAVGGLLTETVGGPYRIPNMRVITDVVYTNSPFSGAMRGFGSPQSNFAIESLMDMLANRLTMDPLELRRKNILIPGDMIFTKVKVNESASCLPRILDEIDKRREQFLKRKPSPGKITGVGFALASQTMGLGAHIPDISNHRLTWQPDGSVLLHLGAPDLGQGLATVAEQVISESLGIPFEKVHTAELDTRTTPNGNVTCASRMTFLVGNAVKSASESLVDQVIDQVAVHLSIDRDIINYQNGVVILPAGKNFPVTEILGRLYEQGTVITVVGSASFPYPSETTPQHLPIGLPHVKFLFGGQVVRVEIDQESGYITVTDIAAIHDVGQVINRTGLEGQIEGGVVMGLGYALSENMVLKQDDRWVDSFSEYLIPTAFDIPEHIETVILEIPEPDGPFGAKGIAEICLVSTAPAIANAVENATGKRFCHLPILPENLVKNTLN